MARQISVSESIHLLVFPSVEGVGMHIDRACYEELHPLLFPRSHGYAALHAGDLGDLAALVRGERGPLARAVSALETLFAHAKRRSFGHTHLHFLFGAAEPSLLHVLFTGENDRHERVTDPEEAHPRMKGRPLASTRTVMGRRGRTIARELGMVEFHPYFLPHLVTPLGIETLYRLVTLEAALLEQDAALVPAGIEDLDERRAAYERLCAENGIAPVYEIDEPPLGEAAYFSPDH